MGSGIWSTKPARTGSSTKLHSSSTTLEWKPGNSKSGCLAWISINQQARFAVKTAMTGSCVQNKSRSQTFHSLKSKSMSQTMWSYFRVNIEHGSGCRQQVAVFFFRRLFFEMHRAVQPVNLGIGFLNLQILFNIIKVIQQLVLPWNNLTFTCKSLKYRILKVLQLCPKPVSVRVSSLSCTNSPPARNQILDASGISRNLLRSWCRYYQRFRNEGELYAPKMLWFMIKNVNELPALERIEQLQSYSQAAVLIITFFCLGVLIRKWIRRDEGTSRLLFFLIFF